MRLDKCITSGGEWTRAQAKQMIRSGRVLVDGAPVIRPETGVEPQEQEILIDGRKLLWRRRHLLMVNKPAGVLTATEDKRDQTVLDLLPERFQKLGLFPAGRLDKDAEGFVLLTNDGNLAHQLMSPKRHVDKVYYVRVAGALEEADAEAFRTGITIDGGYLCAPADMEIIRSGMESEARVTLREGKFHQLKRMYQARNKCVIYLKRESIGGVQLDLSLEPGGFREFTAEEAAALEGQIQR